MKYFLLTFCLSFSLHIWSQDLAFYKNLHPDEEVVTLSLNHHIEVSQSGNRLNISEEMSKTNFFISGNQFREAQEVIFHDSFSDIDKIEAKTLVRVGDKLKEYEVEKFEDKDVLSNGIFFSDQKIRYFIYPNVNVGASTNLKYSIDILDPHIIPSFIMSYGTPVEKAIYSVTFPNGVKIGYKSFNLEEAEVVFTETKDEKTTTYTWEVSSLPKKNIFYDFSSLYYVPQVFVYIESYETRSGVEKILSNTEGLYNWYSGLVANINTTEQSDLQQLTQELVKDAKSEQEKIERIYYFIQDKITYVAFEDGMNGFIPRDAGKVYQNKYGDCKDMANILNEMLRYANIPSYITWIGTRARPYTYAELPTPFIDNHMITAVKVGDDFTFLDATSKYLPYGYPSPFTQGKEALIGIDAANFEVVKVPIVPAADNEMRVVSNFKITPNSMKGSHTVSLKGYEKLDMLHSIDRKDENDLTFLFNTLAFGEKTTGFSDIEYTNLPLDKEMMGVSFNTETQDYFKISGDRLFVKANFDTQYKTATVKGESQNFAKSIEFASSKKYETIIEIPKGYSIESLPKNENFDHPDFNYTITYSKGPEEKSVAMTKEIIINTLKVEKEDIANWNDFIKKLSRANKNSIILKKNS